MELRFKPVRTQQKIDSASIHNVSYAHHNDKMKCISITLYMTSYPLAQQQSWPCNTVTAVQIVPPPPKTAQAWVVEGGVVLSVDATFCDWFGYRPDELPGAYFTNFVAEKDDMNQ
jgi:hypothetical protein